MHSAALDENAHENNESDADQHHDVPVVRDPVGHREQRLFVEQQVLQSHQRTLRIHRATPQEHVAVALEVIARRSWPQTYSALRQVVQVIELARTATGIRVVVLLTRQVAQLALVNVRDDVRREEALGHIPEQTNRSRALAGDAQLRAIVALGLVVARLRLWTLGRRSVATGTPRALGLLAALDILVRLVESAAVVATTRTLARTALRSLAPRTSPGRRIQTQVVLVDLSRIAALVHTLLVVESAVALLATLDNLVAAERALGRLEAVALLVILDRVQHVRNVPDGARREFAVVRPVATRRTGEHDVVAVQASRATTLRVVVLRNKPVNAIKTLF